MASFWSRSVGPLFVAACLESLIACAVASGVSIPDLQPDAIDAASPPFPAERSGAGGWLATGGRASLGLGGGSSAVGGRSALGAGGIVSGFGGVASTGGGRPVAGASTDPNGSGAGAGASPQTNTEPPPPPPPAPPPPPPPPASVTTRLTTPSGRGFLLHVPASVSTNTPVPLVFVHHGYNGSADQIRQLTHFDTIADEKGFVVAFPEGAGASWNAGLGVCGFGQFVTGISDDFGFVAEMIVTIDQRTPIDRRRVFTTGFSMGGYFANNIGCNRPDLVHGIAPHSGGGPPAGCNAEPVPALILHGTIDSLIWYMCGLQARDAWVAHNRCSSQVDVVPVKGGACEWSRGCAPGGQVTFCHFDGMDHGWAGATGKDGGGAQYEDVSRVIWDFFSKL